MLYSWIGGTRLDWRGQKFFRALTEKQEAWALDNGFDEIIVKTKNRFYDMQGTLDRLEFNVVKFKRSIDNRESKVYLSRLLGARSGRPASQQAIARPHRLTLSNRLGTWQWNLYGSIRSTIRVLRPFEIFLIRDGSEREVCSSLRDDLPSAGFSPLDVLGRGPCS